MCETSTSSSPETRSQNNIRVAICISTFRRQPLLAELLLGIANLQFHKVAHPQLSVVVVDTPSDGGSARDLCESMSLPWPIKYVVEPRRGLTYARNSAIATAGPVDFVAFIDDDEIPSVAWLDELLWAQAQFAADVICGPVLARYSPEVAEWIQKGEFFNSPSRMTGTQCKTGATHNALVGRHVFGKVQGFDHEYSLSGAEDTDFFLRAARSGCKIMWSQEAVVYEYISARRGTVKWIVRREYQTGNGWVFCETRMNSRLLNRVVRFIKASAHIAIGSGAVIWSSVLWNRTAVVRSLRRISLGAGMLSALVGHRFLAYRTSRILSS